MIKIGLVGCGRIMPAHLWGYKALIDNNVDVRIAALCARKIEDALRFRRLGEGPPPRKPVGSAGDPLALPHIYVSDFQKDFDVEVYDDYRKMLKEADIDAVEILTSVASHHTIALASLEAGKPALVQKPFAITVKAARKMVEAAEKAGLVLGVAENARYLPDIRISRWIIDQGYIGDVQAVVFGGFGGYWSPNKIVAQTSWRHKKLLAGGGATIDMAVHFFHMLRYLCGEIEEVSSLVDTLEKTRFTRDESGKVTEQVECDVDDTFFSTMKFKGGAIGLGFFSWAGHGEPVSLPRTVYGTKGCIKGDMMILDDGTRREIEPLFEEEASQNLKEKFFPFGIKSPMALETLEFLRAIKEGREMETSGREGLRDLAASFALIESSVAKYPVKVDDVESGKIRRYQEEIDKYYDL